MTDGRTDKHSGIKLPRSYSAIVGCAALITCFSVNDSAQRQEISRLTWRYGALDNKGSREEGWLEALCRGDEVVCLTK